MPLLEGANEVISHLADVVINRSAWLLVGPGDHIVQLARGLFGLIGDMAQECSCGCFTFSDIPCGGTNEVYFLSVPKSLVDIKDLIDKDLDGDEFFFILGDVIPLSALHRFLVAAAHGDLVSSRDLERN